MKLAVLGYTSSASQNTVRLAQAFVLQKHQVLLEDFSRFSAEKILHFSPGVVLVTMGREFDHSKLLSLKEKGIFLVNWIPDEYGPGDVHGGEWFENIKGIYNLLLCETRGIVPLLKDYADEVVWVKPFFDVLYHYSDTKRGIPYVYDIGFLGEPNLNQSSVRTNFLEKLRDVSYNKYIIGVKGFTQFQNGVINGEMTTFYRRTKIGLNFINDKLPQYSLALSHRAFKTMGSGCFLLNHEVPDLKLLMTPGKHCITYSPLDFEDLLSKIDYYLLHDMEREKIAQEGYKLITTEYNINKISAEFLHEITTRMR